MIRHKIGFNNSNLALHEKKKMARNLSERIMPVIRFLEEHSINIADVNNSRDIIEHFKKDFPYPKADVTTNMNLLGIDISGIANASLLAELKDGFYIEGNQVLVSEQWIKEEEESRVYYTRTEEENKAYKFATDLKKLVKKGFNQGFLTSDAIIHISMNNDLVYIEKDRDERPHSDEYRYGGIRQAGERHAKYLATKAS